MSKLNYNKEFNFKNKELSILKSFLKQNEYKIIFVGSFALYAIKNHNHQIGLSLKFNDLDLDFYESIKSEIVKSILINKNKNEKIALRVNNHFRQLVEEIKANGNVSKVEIWLLDGTLEEREGNKGTYGGKLLFVVSDNYDAPHHTYVDINFENKNFDIDLNEYKIENEIYTVRTYVYEKILADKYIAVNKRFKYTFGEALSNLQNQFSGRKKKTNNIKKLWKDIYDIIFIKNICEIDIEKVKQYILMMNERELNLNLINKFIDEIKYEHPNITKSRTNYEDISLLVIKYYKSVYNKIR